MTQTIAPRGGLRGVIKAPGDKSVSHRAVMFASLADGVSRITGFLDGADCRATVDCFRKLGVAIEQEGGVVVVRGNGLRGLKKPDGRLYAANSGTTIRLMAGILAAQDFDCEITGDMYIEKRPMKRVIEPLRLMGADITGRDGGFAPLAVRGGRLRGVEYTLPVASAQVKSCILLAGLYADGGTAVVEPAASRDHTEIMLAYMGADIRREGNRISVSQTDRLNACEIDVCGDISGAAFPLVAAIITQGSEVTVTNVGVNPTRTGILDALAAMGADVSVDNRRRVSGERRADITARSSRLRGAEIGGDMIPRLIDEIPVIAAAALFAEGETVIKDAAELRVKETDRIAVMAEQLRRLGGDVTEAADGMIIRGGRPIKGAAVESGGDHRVAMSLAAAGLAAAGETAISGAECCDVSYPGFFEMMAGLG